MTWELERLGHCVEILCLDDPKESFIGELPMKVYAIGPSAAEYRYNPRLVPWLKAHANQYGAVIIHGLWRYHSFGTWRALRSTTVPYFVYAHGMLDPWFKTHRMKHAKKWLYWPWAEYRVLRDARAVLFTSEEERRGARESFWLYKSRESVVAFGTGTPPTDGEIQRECFLAAHPQLRGRRLILYLGRIHPKKGCDLLIRAFASVAAAIPTLHLVMAGPDQTGWADELKAQAAELKIGDRISWPGMLRDALKWGAFHAAEVFILPSHQENFGIAVAESLGCGVPVLITDRVNIWREIETAGAGLVETDTQAGVERLLSAWCEMPDVDRHSMSAHARQLFMRQFTAKAMAQSLLDVIEERRTDSPTAVPLVGRIAFLGPLPPPLTGFSSITATMLTLLQRQGPVEVFNRARRANLTFMFTQGYQILRFIKDCFEFQRFPLYVALSGGKGQLLDAFYVLISKIFGQRVFIHHHSFGYINSPTLLNRMVFTLLRNSTHITLSEGMARLLAKRYRLKEKNVLVMSNAAFFAETAVNSRPYPTEVSSGPIRLGFLSNITFEKGFADFFAVLAQLRRLKISYRAYVAGPVAHEAQSSFMRLLADSTDVEYLGAIYGEAKEQFYDRLAVLLLPTKYAHEAEPLVVHEALRSGVYVIACDRGAIPDILTNGAGLVFKEDAFVEHATQNIADLDSDRVKLARAQRLAAEQARRLQAAASAALAKLLPAIAAQASAEGREITS
jgi:glycosyltransferase involved in cell wall biosynthesis